MKWFRLAAVPFVLVVHVHAATLRGVVVDLMGAVIPQSRILVRWDPVGLEGVAENVGSKEDHTAIADQAGQFHLDLPPGVYDLFAAAPGFSPHCEKITLERKGIQSYKVHLKVSRMIKVRVN